MLTKQPFFIGGIDDPLVASQSAFGAFAMFMFVFVLSAIGMWYDANYGKKATEVEDENSTAYQLAGGQDFPNYGALS